VDVRNRHGRVGEVICAMRIHASFDLFFCWCAVVLNVAVLEVAVKGLEVEECRNVWVCGGAVVAFIAC
jgi:hypothetical protein